MYAVVAGHKCGKSGNLYDCRDITDGGLAELSRLCHLQILVMNTMSQNVTGAFLSKLQGTLLLNSIPRWTYGHQQCPELA